MVYVPADLDPDDVAGDESDSERVESATVGELADASGDADVADLRQQVGALTRTLDDLLAAEGDADRDVEGIAEAVVDDVMARLEETDKSGEMDADLRGFY